MGVEKPSVEQVAWVFEQLVGAMHDGDSFRGLIYSRMGFGMEAYEPLYMAGGMALTNAFSILDDYRNSIPETEDYICPGTK